MNLFSTIVLNLFGVCATAFISPITLDGRNAGAFTQRIYPVLGVRTRNDDPIKEKSRKQTEDLTVLEQEVLASVQERLDRERVLRALRKEIEIDNQTSTAATAPRWKVAMAAASVSTIFMLFLISNDVFIACAVWIAVFLIANTDPVQEDGVVGPMARLLGRTTLRSVEISHEKIKTLARALVFGEETILLMKKRIAELEKENAELRRWKQTRDLVEANSEWFTYNELKEIARSNGLPMTGTKSDLLLRLIEANVIQTHDDS